MLALTVLAQFAIFLVEKVREERKYIRWAQSSIWGTGEIDKPFATAEEEATEFYSFFMMPYVPSAEQSVPVEQHPSPITIVFPYWDRSVSRYEIRCKEFMRMEHMVKKI